MTNAKFLAKLRLYPASRYISFLVFSLVSVVFVSIDLISKYCYFTLASVLAQYSTDKEPQTTEFNIFKMEKLYTD